jgi:hypothetical protein
MNQYKPLSTLEGRDLVRNREVVFQEDAQARTRAVGPRAYEDALDLYESQGTTRPDGMPEMNMTREAVDDAVSVSVANDPKAHLTQTEIIDPSLSEEERAIRFDALLRSEKTNNRLAQTHLRRNQYPDLRSKALKQAGIFGMGALLYDIDEGVDTMRLYKARQLAQKDLAQWNEADFANYKLLRKNITIRHVDTRDVFFQRGVKSYYSEEMRRVSVLEKRSVKEMRLLYPGHDIKPGKHPYYIEADEGNPKHDTVGVLTTWEIEVVPITKGYGDSEVHFNDYRMVRTTIAGGVLLEKKVWNSVQGPLCLPIVPYYLMESENHPYGYSLARALRLMQNFINSMYSLVYQQGLNSISPQSFAYMISKLGASDSPEEMARKMREGLPIAFEGGPDVQDIREVLQPLNYLNAGTTNPAHVELIRYAEHHFKRMSMAPDREAVAKAESGTAKRTEIAVADRTKTPMIDLQARSEEKALETLYEFIRCTHRDKMAVPIRSQNGSSETVVLNEPKSDYIPVNDDLTGEPATHEAFIDEANPNGYVFEEVSYTDHSTQIEMHAEAEGRGILPVAWEARIIALSSLVQNGFIRPKTARDLGLPEEIAARDDMNAQAEMEMQQALMEQQAAMMQQGTGDATQQMGQQSAFQNMTDFTANRGEVLDNMEKMAMPGENTAIV